MPDVDVVLDTDVLIEILRGADQAKAWLASNASNVIGIPIFVRMEILLGARDKREQQALSEDLTRYTTSTSKQAIRKRRSTGLSNSICAMVLAFWIVALPRSLFVSTSPSTPSTSSIFGSSPGLMPEPHTDDASHPLRERRSSCLSHQ